MKRFPPFAPLVAFEAVARRSSFSRAGEELGLTQSAVSHRVRLLEAIPVCHPSLLPQGMPLPAPEDLADLPLLHKGRPEQQGMEWNWPSWVGPAADDAPARLYFEELGSALAAAAGGAGVALGRSLLVGDAIADGLLARALPPRFDRRSSKVHVVRWRTRQANDRAMVNLVDWLQAVAQHSSEASLAAGRGPSRAAARPHRSLRSGRA